MLTIPATPLRFDDGVEIPRRALTVGSVVTGEDPASFGYGKTGRVVDIFPPDGSDPLRAFVIWDTADDRSGQYTRCEIRDVRDTPPSAQIGWKSTIWTPDE